MVSFGFVNLSAIFQEDKVWICFQSIITNKIYSSHLEMALTFNTDVYIHVNLSNNLRMLLGSCSVKLIRIISMYSYECIFLFLISY